MIPMLRTWLLITFTVAGIQLSAQYVPDLNFRLAIADNCAACIDGTGNLTASAKTLDTLNADNYNIADITGINGFINLEKFFCSQNQISIVPPLPDSLKIF